jgi:hypothetical protein
MVSSQDGNEAGGVSVFSEKRLTITPYLFTRMISVRTVLE